MLGTFGYPGHPVEFNMLGAFGHPVEWRENYGWIHLAISFNIAQQSCTSQIKSLDKKTKEETASQKDTDQ